MLTPHQLDRRTLLKTLACASAAASCPNPAVAQLHSPLPAWTKDHFDLHHIDTGRGNATLLIFPDSTTMLIDAGAASGAPAGTLAPAHPDDSRSPGAWIARYIQANAPAPRLDYFLATHIHPDHIDGLPDVAAQIPIATCIDRGFPHYAPLQQPANAPFAQTYLNLLRTRVTQKQGVQAANVGSTRQIALRHKPAEYPTFTTLILAANGRVWNASTNTTEDHFGSTPGAENLFSVATRFTYGRFSYYTGGDLNCDTQDGVLPALDIESPVARAAGRTEVALANHHGYFDACGPAFAHALDAQAYIIPGWDIGHPGSAQMQRLLGAWDGKATHDVFSLDLLPANALNNRRFAPQLKSQTGHVVVRVAPGGTPSRSTRSTAPPKAGSSPASSVRTPPAHEHNFQQPQWQRHTPSPTIQRQRRDHNSLGRKT